MGQDKPQNNNSKLINVPLGVILPKYAWGVYVQKYRGWKICFYFLIAHSSWAIRKYRPKSSLLIMNWNKIIKHATISGRVKKNFS